ncbi:hypothetical protein [Cystobacter fuscus]|uniref:hypothetical protein n=1 Tax=Cystobacter fuscus TaxID=43 RepID=UPI002B28E63C|nr:hypothetical protein F0U63_37810 [Cystobacter fuscus]
MLTIDFEGWFQCRLATDPDPTDEPRGVSGFTFAVAGEPDFDRVIRFHDPVAPRSHGPRVGVFVKSVALDGQLVPEHPLRGGRVELLGEPKFESRNYVLRDSAQGSIVPFHLRISAGELVLEREDPLFSPDPSRALHRVPVEHLARRGSLIPMTQDFLRIADATGIRDPVAYRRQRKAVLEADLRETADPVARAALGKRIRELSIEERERLQVVSLSLYNDYRFAVAGNAVLQDAGQRLGLEVDSVSPWPITFWMGAWDTDALSGFVRGMISIPRSTSRKT